jgi:hypothetical protein
MELKYTLEILAKDIQDIGKLVENLHNSPDGSTLELDLALSKIRNVYDVLNEIRTDIYTQRKPEPEQPQAPEPAMEPPVNIPEPEQPQATVPAMEPPVNIPEPPVNIPEPEPVHAPVRENNHGIIAEKYTAESSINENMAGTRDKEMDSKLFGPPIDNIGKNIGINDRFLIIRELFDGDSDGFGKLIRDLDNAAGLQEANERLKMQFKNSPNHEGVSILGILVKRRFSAT